jgi:hypothetical protein
MTFQSQLFTGILCVFLSLGFSQCSSSQKVVKISHAMEVINKVTPKAYYQNWVAGVKGGGSGTNVFIHKSLLENKIVDSIYFQNKVAKLLPPNDSEEFFTAAFKRELNQFKEPEEKNLIQAPLPFDLKENELVVSYLVKGDKKYLKITNVIKKQGLAYPSAPRH